MKEWNQARIQQLEKELEEYGYIIHPALTWSDSDFDLRCEKLGIECSEIGKKRKQSIMTDFFDENLDDICELINDRLTLFISNASENNEL